VNEYLGWADP